MTARPSDLQAVIAEIKRVSNDIRAIAITFKDGPEGVRYQWANKLDAIADRLAALAPVTQEAAAWYAQGICNIEFTNTSRETVERYIANHNAGLPAGCSPNLRLRGPFPLVAPVTADKPLKLLYTCFDKNMEQRLFSMPETAKRHAIGDITTWYSDPAHIPTLSRDQGEGS